ncbi:MAG: LysR substrate-binding domain-containing protein [Ginsengibacter sp.]|jgi:DNA-binding transcriptional LysR family regulator
MFDFRLQVFQAVAKRLNFTKAAEELYITQPAVTKHIHELEHQFKVKLFDRNGSRIKLTAAGETLLQHTELLFGVYRNLEFEMSNLIHQHNGTLKIGASTTVAQYVLPAALAEFHKKFTDIKIDLITNNTEVIETALKNKQIDLGIIEGRSKNTAIKYTEFLKDEIVLVTSTKNTSIKKNSIQAKELLKIPLLMREPGSGTLEVIAHALKAVDIKMRDLNIEMQLAGTESIKSYLAHCNCMAFLSMHSILNEIQRNELKIISVNNLQIERYFYFIQLQGQSNNLPELFMKFMRLYNFK